MRKQINTIDEAKKEAPEMDEPAKNLIKYFDIFMGWWKKSFQFRSGTSAKDYVKYDGGWWYLDWESVVIDGGNKDAIIRRLSDELAKHDIALRKTNKGYHIVKA